MNNALRRISFFIGIGLLAVSMFWSQDGFNFDVAGQSGYKTMAIFIGWFLALSVTCVEFVFSSNFKELNPSLIFFGLLAYAYSIYTNYQGILHFQGDSQSKIGAMVLGVVMDGLPEPLIAWSLYESLSGDFIGNLIKAFISSPDRYSKQNQGQVEGKSTHVPQAAHRPKYPEYRTKPEAMRGFPEEIMNKIGKKGESEPVFRNLHGVKDEKHHSRFE